MPKPTDAIENLVKSAAKTAASAATTPITLPMSLLRPKRQVTVGGVPGLTPEQIAEQLRDQREPADISVIDYGGGRVERQDDIQDFKALLQAGRPDWTLVRWINIVGTHDPDVLSALAKHYELHPLAMEDVVNAASRPKVETYGKPEIGRPRYFLAARMIYQDGPDKGLISEQVSLFAGPHTVITIQQRGGDVWERVRERIKNPTSRFHERGPGYLLFALLDAMIDGLFPLLDGYADRINEIEDRILDPVRGNDNTIIHDIHRLKRELMLLRKEAGPMRELIRSILEQDNILMDEQTRVFMRDVGEHAVAAIELLETYHELTQGLADAWVNMASHRMNEVMKVLTIVAALFIPISFLAGVFGMNFEEIPYLRAPGAFAGFCFACIGIVVFMLVWFKRRGWL
ncbi:MAG: magnesium/cobalt transporter CorA [Phycisphaeraceae bacterium]